MPTWSANASNYLLDTTRCPRCGAALVGSGSCVRCLADLSGPAAIELAAASRAVSALILRRQDLLDALPTIPAIARTDKGVSTPSILSPRSPGAPLVAPGRQGSHVSVQSVLAVAGAGLFAVAAIVFTFFNSELTNFATRTSIIAVITVLFLGGAWLLSRRGLQFSAEALGALGAVFAALDVWALSDAAPGSATGWLFLGIGTAVASTLLLALAVIVRVRTWLWTSLVGLQLVPGFVALSFDNPWITALGWVVTVFFSLGAHAIARRLNGRLASSLRAERVTATIVQLVALVLVACQLVLIGANSVGSVALLASGVVAALAIMTGLSARTMLPRFWSYVTGILVVIALALLPLSLAGISTSWLIALVAVCAGCGLAALAWVGPWIALRPAQLRAGGVTVVVLAAVPAIGMLTAQLLATLGPLVGGVIGPDPTVGGSAVITPEFGLAAIVALGATAAGMFAVSVVARYGRGGGFRTASVWFAMMAVIAFAGWSALLRPTQSLLAVGLAVALSFALARVPLLAAAPRSARWPAVAGVHVLVGLAGVISWTDPSIRVLVGMAVVCAIAVLSMTVRRALLPFYVAAAYAYALAIFAAALDIAGLKVLAVVCLTTALASISALIATLTPWLRVRSWYAILTVTAVPFAIGVISVLVERSGWTALSTGVTFALLLTLVLTRRDGMTRFMRSAAASLLMPALAVVVISLGAEVLAVSASPITLPVIAVLVACILPATELVGAFLVRHGIPVVDARAARIAIEASLLVTAVCAVLLALVRSAAGLPTTFLVLLILGIGALATAVFAKRRYGWPAAGASWTGALWCVWALSGVTAVEPYLLPPALGMALAAAFLIARGLPGMGLSAVALFWTGLGSAVVPILAMLAATGSGGVVPWRTAGLMAGACALLVLGALIPRLGRSSRLHRVSVLRTPMLVMAVVAAGAGMIQAARYGANLEQGVGVDGRAISGELVMMPVVLASVAATGLAAIGARMLASDGGSVVASTSRTARSRALYVPAVVYLVIGPIVAIRPGWFPILTLLILTVLLLVLMIATSVRARVGQVTLPPVAFLFVVAWCTAVASWSERELRVEAYSLPLGIALLTVGIMAMGRSDNLTARPSLLTWPGGFEGSWRLLGPGLLVILVPSVLATGTDPLTQRAILVIAVALVAILIGNMRRLAAPFILGIIVLPVENVVVFAVQIGGSIGALPWWITLATAGAVLLVIAVSSERGSERGTAARLRDLT